MSVSFLVTGPRKEENMGKSALAQRINDRGSTYLQIIVLDQPGLFLSSNNLLLNNSKKLNKLVNCDCK
jgi:hypothetical protein